MFETQEQIIEAPSEPLLETAEEARVAKIRAALDEIRPFLQRDGGDCQLVGVDGNVVKSKWPGPASVASLLLSPFMAYRLS